MSLDIVLSVFLPVLVVLLPIDFVDFRHDSAVQSSLTALAAPEVPEFNNLVYHITKHIKIKGKITHFATNLLILQ